MSELGTILQQARTFVEQHAPAELVEQAGPLALVCLVGGVGLSVFGAKLARVGLTCAFAVAGAYAGVLFSRQADFPFMLTAAAGAVMVGIIGFHTFRLWAGLVTALVFSAAVLGAFGYQRVLPHVEPFERSTHVVAAPGEAAFALASPEEAQAYRERTPRQWAGELWSYICEQDVRFEGQARAIALGAMVTGLCLGVLAVRWALILSTALVGVSLVSIGGGMLMGSAAPQAYQAFYDRPALAGVGAGGLLVTSIVVQTILTRRAPQPKDGAGKS